MMRTHNDSSTYTNIYADTRIQNGTLASVSIRASPLTSRHKVITDMGMMTQREGRIRMERRDDGERERI